MEAFVVAFVLSGLNVCFCFMCPIWDSCRHLSWGNWGQCSSTCGQGEQHRQRGLCCFTAIIYSGPGCAVTKCGNVESEYHDYKTCNAACCNDGAPDRNGTCACLLGFEGDFCENLRKFSTFY